MFWQRAASSRRPVAVQGLSARFSTICFLLTGLSLIVGELLSTECCLSRNWFSGADRLQLAVYGRPRLRLSNAKPATYKSWKTALLLLLLCGDISTNPGPSVLLADLPVGTPKSPLFGSVNLCGLLSKLHDIGCLTATQHPQALALQETHLSAKVDTSEPKS